MTSSSTYPWLRSALGFTLLATLVYAPVKQAAEYEWLAIGDYSTKADAVSRPHPPLLNLIRPPTHSSGGWTDPSPAPEWMVQRDCLEDLITALTSAVTWEQLSIAAASAYPELLDDFLSLHPTAIPESMNPVRAARERYRLRVFVTEAVLQDYAAYPVH